MIARAALAGVALLALGACGDQAASPAPEPTAASTPAAAAAPAAVPDPRVARRTSVKDCPVVESAPEEAGYVRTRCAGEGGFTVERVEADGRSNLVIMTPGGIEHSLGLPSLMGGGIGTVGDQLEWRGTDKVGQFMPDALVLRYEAQESPDPAGARSYLLAVRLDPANACVTAKVPPGPEQESRARALADRPGGCVSI